MHHCTDMIQKLESQMAVSQLMYMAAGREYIDSNLNGGIACARGTAIRYPPPPCPLYELRPFPSYSGCRDHINLGPNLTQ